MSKRKENEKEKEIKEMVDMEIDRVDAVSEPATRMKFLIIKSLDREEGETLEDLLNKAKEDVSKAESKEDREKLREEAERRAKKYGISFKEGKGHLTPPKGKPTDPEQYGDPVNYAYPIDEKHIRPAVSYFNHEGMREAGGYTPKEWEIIGKRIAAAANRYLGEGYKYENGKIVTPNNSEDKGETKKGDDVMADVSGALEIGDANTNPGSPAWERVDAQMMKQAVDGLLALKELLCKIVQREKAEVFAGHDEDRDQVDALLGALDAITFAVKEVAGVAALESIEAKEGEEDNSVMDSVEKAGRKMSKESMQKVHQAMTHIANAAGFKTIKDFHEACKAMGIVKEDDSDDDTQKAKRHMSEDDAQKAKRRMQEDDDTQKARNCKSNDGDDMSKGKDKQSTMKSAVSESLTAEAVAKALEATGLTTLAKSAGDLLEAVKGIKALEERVQALENQPMPGGPMLRGTATMQDYYLVKKGESPNLKAPGVLEQALEYVQDPYIRDVLSREAARRLHPLHQQNQEK